MESPPGPPADDRPPPRGLPPGQHAVRELPVLHVGEVPVFDPQDWRLRVHGEVEQPRAFGWRAFLALRPVEVHADFHCVTGWSRLGNRWRGVPVGDLLRLAEPREAARFVRLSDGGQFEAGLSLEQARSGDVLLAFELDGQPLSAAHGGPLRAIVPQRYGWKSVKWVREIEVCAEDPGGYWESRGYHPGADPWRSERMA